MSLMSLPFSLSPTAGQLSGLRGKQGQASVSRKAASAKVTPDKLSRDLGLLSPPLPDPRPEFGPWPHLHPLWPLPASLGEF